LQRLFDILFSFLALLALAPIFFLVIIILRFTGEGEIFFIQKRVGKGGKYFGLFKFATMLKNSPNIGTGTITIKGDPRVLPFGSILRKTKINELPQLLNIFLGHMSVIGPRPLTSETFNAYDLIIQKTIQQVRPGLSGIGSIIFRDEENVLSGGKKGVGFYSNIIAPYKGLLEEWYVEHHNIYIYFIAIILTILIVIFPKTQLPWLIFKNLPIPPDILKNDLNYPSYGNK
jgi:lipopolysaccharide/colanic/teichoic acid biosynthesis glycosyltransferase